MISRIASAFLRAFLVALLVATPSLMLPGVSADTKQIVALIALCGALLTLVEYGAEYPSLIEFRDAPPFNRIRFFSIYVTVFLLSLIGMGQTNPSTLTMFTEAIGSVIGHAIDFPYSPVRLVLLSMPPEMTLVELDLIRAAAGLSYLTSLLSLAIFVVYLRLAGWPNSGSGGFNVWINLPTFEPTAGGDVVERLQRDGRINVVLGFLLPFISPMVFAAMSDHMVLSGVTTPQTMVWVMATWAFLPASLFMRGIAMTRLADMILDQRTKGAGPGPEHSLPA